MNAANESSLGKLVCAVVVIISGAVLSSTSSGKHEGCSRREELGAFQKGGYISVTNLSMNDVPRTLPATR